MTTVLPSLLLLVINLGLLWLFMAAPLGQRTITVKRSLKAEPRRVWDAVRPAGFVADWNTAILSAEPVASDGSLVRHTFRNPDRKGRPMTRTLQIVSSSDAGPDAYAFDACIVDDSALDAGFWRHFREQRQVTAAIAGTELTVSQTDRYRGIAFLLFRYFSLRRELNALETFLATGGTVTGGLIEHPATQAALAIASTLMLWPFFGLHLPGLVLSSALTMVIVLHELGHMAAYRAFGHETVRMIFIPLLGGIAVGGRPYNSLFEVATCALMGAGMSAFFVPLVIAVHDAAGQGMLPPFASLLSLVFLLILGAFNLLNLLPMDRFDGGQVLRQVFPSRPLRAIGSFCLTLVILWVGWRIGLSATALFISLSVFTLMSVIVAGFGRSAKPRNALDEMAPGERLMAGFGLYAAVAIHGYAIIYACDHLFA